MPHLLDAAGHDRLEDARITLLAPVHIHDRRRHRQRHAGGAPGALEEMRPEAPDGLVEILVLLSRGKDLLPGDEIPVPLLGGRRRRREKEPGSREGGGDKARSDRRHGFLPLSSGTTTPRLTWMSERAG